MKGREFMSMPNEVVLVTKQLVDMFVDELLDRDRLSFICLVDDRSELDSILYRINHDAGKRDLLYNLHLIDVETYHSIGNLLMEFAQEVEKQYVSLDELSDSSDDGLSDSIE